MLNLNMKLLLFNILFKGENNGFQDFLRFQEILTPGFKFSTDVKTLHKNSGDFVRLYLTSFDFKRLHEA